MQFIPKLKTVDGQLVYVGASGRHYPLDDYPTAADARKAANDQPPHWGAEKNEDNRG